MKSNHDLSRAIQLLNRLTRPDVPRSDSEWSIYRKAARKVRRFIESNWTRHCHYRESDNGKFYVA